MNQTTLATFLKWIERPFQTTVEKDRPYLIDMANLIREKMYNAYQEYEIEVDVEECFQVQRFCQCGQCESEYMGITLPSYMNTVEAAWFLNTPITLYSKWRESKVGLKTSANCLIASYDRPGFYPTERDLSPCGAADVIQFLARSPLDSNKKVRIVYESDRGEETTEEISLQSGAWMGTNGLVRYIKSVILPPSLKSGVDIRQATGGRVLSNYSPFETVPSYKRIKLTGVCDKAVVVIRASRNFTPLWDDYDIVETGNREAVDNAARHLFYSNSGAEGGMIQKSEYHRGLFMNAIKGEQSRDIGLNRENTHSGPPIRASRLRGNRTHAIRRR